MRVRYILKGLENLKETAPSTELSPLWVPLSSELPVGPVLYLRVLHFIQTQDVSKQNHHSPTRSS